MPSRSLWLFLGILLCEKVDHCRGPLSVDQKGEEGRDVAQLELDRLWEHRLGDEGCACLLPDL